MREGKPHYIYDVYTRHKPHKATSSHFPNKKEILVQNFEGEGGGCGETRVVCRMRLQEAENSVNAPPPPPVPFPSASHLRSKSGTSDVYDVPHQDGWWCIFRESVIRHLFFIFPYISFFPGRRDGNGGGMGEAQRGRTAPKHTAIRKYTEYVFFV